MSGLIITEQGLSDHAAELAAAASAVLVRTSNDVEECLRRLYVSPGPRAATILVGEELIDILFPPEAVVAVASESERARNPPTEEQERDIHQRHKAFIAAGVCFTVTPRLVDELRHRLPSTPPPENAHVVALCPVRLEGIAKSCTLRSRTTTDADLHDATELVWLHELIHWSHGATSNSARSRNPEEAVTQITLSHVLRGHPREPRLRSLMERLADRQPRPYGAFRPPSRELE